jgi:hypothetical protein
MLIMMLLSMYYPFLMWVGLKSDDSIFSIDSYTFPLLLCGVPFIAAITGWCMHAVQWGESLVQLNMVSNLAAGSSLCLLVLTMLHSRVVKRIRSC